jgi:hypothetical protein
MNHQAKIIGINSLQVKGESAMLAFIPVADLLGMWKGSSRLNHSLNTQ